jgi:hypothetical protein
MSAKLAMADRVRHAITLAAHKSEIVPMAWYVVTYDIKKTIPGGEGALLTQAGNLGWTTWCPAADENGQQILLRLPKTTLMGQFPSLRAADEAFNFAIEKTKTAVRGADVVEKYLLVAKRAAILHSDETPY